MSLRPGPCGLHPFGRSRDRAVLPACRQVAGFLTWARFFPGGSIQMYLLYIFLTLLALLLWR